MEKFRRGDKATKILHGDEYRISLELGSIEKQKPPPQTTPPPPEAKYQNGEHL